MEVLPEKYRDFHKVNLTYLEELISSGSLSEEVASKLLDYWQLRFEDERDPFYSDYFEYYLFFEAINAGVLLVFIYESSEKKVLHQYGIMLSAVPEIIRFTQADHKESQGRNIAEFSDFNFQGSQYTLWRRHIQFENNDLFLCAMLPRNLKVAARLQRIHDVFLRYYLPESLHADRRFMDFFSALNQHIIQKITPVIADNRPVTFTYFKFEEYDKYISFAGENFATVLVKELTREITNRLKQEDRCYIINPREYLIVSLNCEKEIMEKRFHRLIFQIKSLILGYRVRYTTWKMPITGLPKIWKEIAIID